MDNIGEDDMPQLEDESEDMHQDGEEYEEGVEEGQEEEGFEGHVHEGEEDMMEGAEVEYTHDEGHEGEGERVEHEGEYGDEPPQLTNELEGGEEYVDEEEEAVENEAHSEKPQPTEHNNNNEADGEQTEADASTKRKRSASHSSGDEGPKKKQVRSNSTAGSQKRDMYCWVCHRDGVQAYCKICPRSFHIKCMQNVLPLDKGKPQNIEKNCICPDCTAVMNAENIELRAETLKHLSVDQLIIMLKYACQRMQSVPGAEPFLYPVDPEDAVDYFKYIVYPMDLSALENNVKKRQYGSTEAFLADAQWLVHNSVVFNSPTSPFTVIARKILKVCRQEITDIETCSECYVNAHSKPDVWFVEACKRPHILVWAKLKGFPFWPGKAMNISNDSVDVRFFGAHDRAWVARKDCFLYSKENPIASVKRHVGLQTAIEELNAHIEKLNVLHGRFEYAAPRTLIGPQISTEAIKIMLPEYKPDEPSSAKAVPSSSQQPVKKSPMTIRISSLKTNPTIVNNSVVEETTKMADSKVAVATSPRKTEEQASDKVDDVKAKEDIALAEKDQEQGAATEPEQQEEEEKCEVETAELEPTKPTGILATALTSRLTRRNSRSETGSASPSSGITRQPEDDSGNEQRESTPPPPKSFLNSLGLMKSSEVKKKPVSTSQLGKLLHPSEVFVKQEPDNDDSGDEGTMEGLRFNLSKDISISPVGDDGEECQPPLRQRVFQGHGARIVPGLMAQNMASPRPRQMLHNGGGQMQRMGGPRVLMRPNRPGMPMRPGMKMNGPRPQTTQLKAQLMKPKDTSLMVDPSGSFANTAVSLNQLNQVQGSIQGAITLPGGTITVTPLAPVIGVPFTADGTLNGGQAVVKQTIASTASGGLPFSVVTSHDGGQSLLKSNNKPNIQRRNLINQVPAAVGHLVSNLQKTLAENVKTTMEQIVLEMLEKSTSASTSGDTKTLKDENEKLKRQLMEQKQHNDQTIRELRQAFAEDKKRALFDVRKTLEQEKHKAVEETKKKQWCAKCGREAQFYCCWNTSYCGYPCQEEHWPSHMNSCSQTTGGGGSRQ